MLIGLHAMVLACMYSYHVCSHVLYSTCTVFHIFMYTYYSTCYTYYCIIDPYVEHHVGKAMDPNTKGKTQK